MRIEHWLYTIPLRLRSLFRRKRVEQELDEELRYHLQRKIEENLARGMTREQALRAARQDFGGFEQSKEECRDMRQVNWLQDAMDDLRYGFRMMRKTPGFCAVAVLTVALAIGACSSIFSVVSAVLLRKLPYKSADRLVLLWGTGGRTTNRDQISFTDLQDWRRSSHSFDEMANFHTYVYTMTGRDETQRVRALQVSEGYFRVMQTTPLLGRFFVENDFKPGYQQVVVLSYDFWRKKFGGDPSALGQKILLNLRPSVIVGVTQPDLASLPNSVIFRPPSQLYTPVEEQYSADNRMDRHLRGIGLLKNGVPLSQAQAELEVLVAGLQKRFPNEDGGRGVRLVTLKDDLVRNVRWTLIIMQLAVLMVVMIACANIANLLLARSTTRQREIAIRGALGATRARLARQVLTESVLLSLIGGSLGELLAYWSLGFLTSLGANVLPELSSVTIDLPVLAFTTVIALLTGLVFGAAPALHFSPLNLGNALKAGTRGTSAASSQLRMRSALVSAEVGLSVVLLLSAGLLLKSFVQLQHVDPGFDPGHVAMTFVYPPRLQNEPIAQQQAFFANLIKRVSALPGIETVGISSGVPDSGDFDTVRMKLKGKDFVASQRPMPDRFMVSPGYFATLRIPLLKGRLFHDADDQAHPLVVIVNQLLVDRLFTGQDPLGQQIQIPAPGNSTEETEPYWTIVGVVGNVVQNGLASQRTMQVYVPYSQYECETSNLFFRSEGDPLQLSGTVRAELRDIDATLLAPEFAAMEQVLSGSIVEQRFSTTLLTIFGISGLLLAAIGIYGVVSYSVVRRTHEIGIRVALGAQKADILRRVIGQGMTPVLLGLGAGIIGALGCTRVLSGLLFGVKPTDPLTFIVISLILTCVALLASYIPARRAMRVDPLVALRDE